MKTYDDYIRERLELAGLGSDRGAIAAIRGKLESDPLCRLDDLIRGIQMLREKNHQNCLQLTNELMLKCARNEPAIP